MGGMDQMAVIETHQDDGAVRIVGSGSLDFTNSVELHNALTKSCESADSVCVDFRKADFIDTAVLEYLARAAKTMLQRGKRLIVMCLENSHPLHVLKITNLNQLMDVQTEPRPT